MKFYKTNESYTGHVIQRAGYRTILHCPYADPERVYARRLLFPEIHFFPIFTFEVSNLWPAPPVVRYLLCILTKENGRDGYSVPVLPNYISERMGWVCLGGDRFNFSGETPEQICNHIINLFWTQQFTDIFEKARSEIKFYEGLSKNVIYTSEFVGVEPISCNLEIESAEIVKENAGWLKIVTG